jgi:superfamily II DNA/RNA helicase
MVCDSTYLIDKETNISPKLTELVPILKEIVVENRRKAIIFSEWTTMTYLIGKVLSDLHIGFVEFTGKIPIAKRQSLVTEFQENPDCMVFLSTDAGGVGLNLQNADCIINFDLPWNPAKLNQRIGRVNRIGQKSRTINVVNLVMKDSLEMNVLSGINLKQDLFDAVLEGGADEVDFSRESKDRFLNSVRALFGGEPEITSARTIGPELEDTTPYYLNPKALAEDEPAVDLEAEEYPEEEAAKDEAAIHDTASSAMADTIISTGGSSPSSPMPAEAMVTVLNQGLAFLNSLAVLSTGKALFSDSAGASVTVDKDTGEVVMRFNPPKTTPPERG